MMTINNVVLMGFSGICQMAYGPSFDVPYAGVGAVTTAAGSFARESSSATVSRWLLGRYSTFRATDATVALSGLAASRCSEDAAKSIKLDGVRST